MSIYVCTVDNSLDPKFTRRYVENCRLFDIPTHILGRGVEWKGNNTKFEVLLDEIPNIRQNYDVMLFTDSRDVLFTTSMTKIEKEWKRFQKRGVELLFSAETNLWPDTDILDRYPNSKHKYRFLNSGQYIGTIDRIEALLTKIIEEFPDYNGSDQQLLHHKYLDAWSARGYFQLDHDCRLFQCLWDENYGRSANFDMVYDYQKRTIYNQLTATYPCILHAPGPTTVLRQAWKVLNGYY